MRIIKLKIFPVPVRLHSGYGKLIVFVIISPFFAIFKNVEHSYSASRGVNRPKSEILKISPGVKGVKGAA